MLRTKLVKRIEKYNMLPIIFSIIADNAIYDTFSLHIFGLK